VLAAAEEIIFIDIPRRKAYLRVFLRNLPYLFRSRPGLPEDCPEILRVRRLVRGIWRFNRKHRAEILRRIADPQNRQTIHHIRSKTELDAWVDVFARRPAGT
jgi:hypothetical protein